MSVSDPLIKELKGWILKFMELNGNNVEIVDENEHLHGFCICLENIFTKGLIVRNNTIGFPKQTEAWTWMLKIAEEPSPYVTYSYTTAVERVRNFPCVTTNTGRLRLLLRSCLVHRCLHVPVQALARVSYRNLFYDPNYSILGEDILREITISLLLQCANLRFNLILSRATFLDDSWLVPHYETVELVPCLSLGICVTFVCGKAVIVNIKPSSVADDENKLEVGDVLFELNGNPITTSMQGKLGSIMKNGIGKPITVRIIKARYKNTFELYPPIIGLLKQLNIDPEIIRCAKKKQTSEDELDRIETNENDAKEKCKNARPGYQIIYVGSVATGKHGEVKQIDKAIRVLLAPKNVTIENEEGVVQRTRQLAMFEIQEIGVKVTDAETGNVLHNHSYMEIASCGSTVHLPKYFAYIAGDKYCNLSKSFTCYVFFTENDETLQFILQSIAQGFQRTHYAV